MKEIIFILACGLAFLGCSRSHSTDHDRETWFIGHGITIQSWGSGNRDEQANAAIAHVTSWVAFFGRDTGPFQLTIVDDQIHAGQVCRYTGPVTGCVLDGHDRDPKSILVWAGNKNELPALFHELCHKVRFNGRADPNHAALSPNGGWPAWDQAGGEVSQMLRNNR